MRSSPVLHFLLIGAALFALRSRPDAAGPAGAAARPQLTISRQQVAQLRREFARQSGREPDRDELTALIDKAVDDALLYREALAMGLDRGDRSVEWRLAEKMRFLVGEGAASDVSDLARQARALGLDRDDPVLQAMLVEKMRLLPRIAAADDRLDPAVVTDYFALHRDDYRQPAHLDFTHVFLSAGRRGAALEADAAALLARLQAAAMSPEEAARLGDAFPAPARCRDIAPRGVDKLFGADFTTGLAGLPVGRWSGPIRSPYGLHLVFVHAAPTDTVPALAEVRTQVERRLVAEQRAARVETLLTELRAAYEIRIEDGRDDYGANA
jgi:hypothetical protein